jgi:hypothetical protein
MATRSDLFEHKDCPLCGGANSSELAYWPEMRERALELGAPDDRIISLYEVE